MEHGMLQLNRDVRDERDQLDGEDRLDRADTRDSGSSQYVLLIEPATQFLLYGSQPGYLLVLDKRDCERDARNLHDQRDYYDFRRRREQREIVHE
jgi:hypothetical protein